MCNLYREVQAFILHLLAATLYASLVHPFHKTISIGMNSRARRPPNVTFTVISMLSDYTKLSCLQLIHFIQCACLGFRYCIHI